MEHVKDNLSILFVDDEPQVLDGLRRVLHQQRGAWDMLFVGSAREALTAMGERRFDVVVSDVHMPGMDGAELFSEVIKRWPETLRIFLSGSQDDDILIRAVGPSHQYLKKPFDAQRLQTVISRASSFRAVYENERFSFVSRIRNLPISPIVVNELIDEVRKPRPSPHFLAWLIEQDVGMSAKILQLANSEYYEFEHAFISPGGAVRAIGVNNLRSLILHADIFSNDYDKTGRLVAMDHVLKHSQMVGQLAKKIITSEGGSSHTADAGFAAGLLHDCGKLILSGYYPYKWKAALRIARQEKTPLHMAEQRIFDVNHAQVGAYLLSIWGIPRVIVDAVVFHHDPDWIGLTSLDVKSVVYVADYLVHQGTDEDSPTDYAHTDLDAEYLAAIGVDAQKLSAWRALMNRSG